ncbi:MAG: hypothetical protein Q9207_003830 [Kuettlingeria erythrocarpa]
MFLASVLRPRAFRHRALGSSATHNHGSLLPGRRYIHLVHCIYAPSTHDQGKLNSLAWYKLRDASQDKVQLVSDKGRRQVLPFIKIRERLEPGQCLEKLDKGLNGEPCYRISNITPTTQGTRIASGEVGTGKSIKFVRAGRGKEMHLNSTLNVAAYQHILRTSMKHINDGCRVEMHVNIGKSERGRERMDLDTVMVENPHLRPDVLILYVTVPITPIFKLFLVFVNRAKLRTQSEPPNFRARKSLSIHIDTVRSATSYIRFAMPFADIFSDIFSSLSLQEAHAEAPPADEDSEDKNEEDGASEEKSEEGEEGEKEEGGDDEGAEDGGDDEEGEEEEEEEEPEDIKPKLEEECANSSQCAPLKLHYEHCAERVQHQQEDENYKGPKEDCVEECKLCDRYTSSLSVSPVVEDSGRRFPA